VDVSKPLIRVDDAAPPIVLDRLAAADNASIESFPLGIAYWDDSLRVSILVVRKRDGKICSLGVTSDVDADGMCPDLESLKRGDDGNFRGHARCFNGNCLLPSMMEAPKENIFQHAGQPPPKPPAEWVLYPECFLYIKLMPNECCTCGEDFNMLTQRLEPNEYYATKCACGLRPLWSLERTELTLLSRSDPDLEEAEQRGATYVSSVDDLLRVLESPTAAHRWV
jgi:hypothetical protein